VLGIKTRDSGQPAYYVPEYAKRAGYEIVPVPVYYPDVTEILDERVYRTVSQVPGEVDMVNVFRRARDIDAHVDDILAKHPASVWFQLGIRNDAAAERFARAGIDVVQDRCLLVELGAIGR
jgi:predicted CoA-binding protein